MLKERREHRAQNATARDERAQREGATLQSSQGGKLLVRKVASERLSGYLNQPLQKKEEVKPRPDASKGQTEGAALKRKRKRSANSRLEQKTLFDQKTSGRQE